MLWGGVGGGSVRLHKIDNSHGICLDAHPLPGLRLPRLPGPSLPLDRCLVKKERKKTEGREILLFVIKSSGTRDAQVLSARLAVTERTEVSLPPSQCSTYSDSYSRLSAMVTVGDAARISGGKYDGLRWDSRFSGSQNLQACHRREDDREYPA